MSPLKQAVFCAVAVALVVLYYDLFVAHPTTARILFIQTATGSRKVPLEVFAQYDPSIVADCLTPFSACTAFHCMFSKLEWDTMRQAAGRALGLVGTTLNDEQPQPLLSTGGVFVDASHVRVEPPKASPAQSEGDRRPFAREGASAAGSPVQPKDSDAATGSSETGGVAKSRNAPAGVPLVTAPSHLRNSHLRYTAKHHLIEPLQLLMDYPIAHLACTVGSLCNVPWITANLISVGHLILGAAAGYCYYRATWHDHPTTVPDVEDDGMELRAETDAHQLTPQTASIEPPEVLAPKDSVQQLEFTGKRHQRIGSSTDNAVMATINSAPAKQQQAPSITVVEAMDSSTGGPARLRRRRRWILFATALFMMRNFFDVLDGVVARNHSARNATYHPLAVQPLVFGMNGHTIDTACDLLGGFLCCLGLLFTLWHQPIVVGRIPNLILTKLGLRAKLRHDPSWSRKIAFAGLLYVFVTAAIWDFFMIKHVNLFDFFSDGNDAVFLVEQHSAVRLNQFLWSLSCADSTFTLLIAAILLDQLWLVLQWLTLIGYPWLVLLTLHSLSVWYGIVSPTAAVVAELYGSRPAN